MIVSVSKRVWNSPAIGGSNDKERLLLTLKVVCDGHLVMQTNIFVNTFQG